MERTDQWGSHKKKVKERIVLREIHLRTTRRHLSNGITVLSATRQRWPPHLHPNRAGWYSIYRPHKDERLSWPSWLITYRNGLPVHRRSPIRVLTATVEGIGENTATYLSNFTLQKPINHPPVRLDVIYDVTYYSTLALESCYPRVTVSIFS